MGDFNATHEIREGVDVVWQIPANPKAVLYLAHSANGTPFSYWPPHPSAPKCTGTPEHKVLVKQALARGFAVIASKSITSEWEAWPSSCADVQKVVKILKSWTAEHGLEELPLTAWGTSIGGDFVSTLALEVKMFSLVIMISHGRAEAIKAAVAGQYPPTLWVPMIKDERTFTEVKTNLEIFMDKGIPSALVEAPPHPVDPHFLAEHIDELNEEESAKLLSLFVEYGIVAEDNSLRRALMDHDVEPFLRLASILPQQDAEQHKRDLEKVAQIKEGAGSGGPPGGRGRRSGPPDGRVGTDGRGDGPPPGGKGHGPPNLGGGPPASDPLAHAVANQLRVAEGRHTLTSRHNSEIFDWIEGKTWPNVRTQ